jgi:hypothetical protein
VSNVYHEVKKKGLSKSVKIKGDHFSKAQLLREGYLRRGDLMVKGKKEVIGG